MFRVFLKYLFPDYMEKHYDTIRYTFHAVVISAILAGLATVSSQNASYITILPNKTSVTEGEQFSIDIIATVHVPVNAVDLVIAYPDKRVTVEGIDTGTSVITLWTQEPYAEKGNIYLRGGTFRKGFIGEHIIARVKVRAAQSGDVKIFLKDSQLVAGDGQGTEIEVSKNSSNNEAKIIVMDANGVIAGKADGDGDVDLKDVSAFMSAWFTRSSMFDFNNDGRMNFRDFSILLADSFSK
jgi:hypothetical protein